MNAGEILTLLFFAMTAIVGLLALLVFLAAVMPRVTARSKMAIIESPRRAFFVGLANYIFVGGISLLLLNAGDILAVLGAVFFAALFTVTMLGLAGVALHTGERLAELRRMELSPFKQMVWGTLTVELAMVMFPVFGWVVVAPAVMMTAFGAAVVAWRNRKMDIGE